MSNDTKWIIGTGITLAGMLFGRFRMAPDQPASSPHRSTPAASYPNIRLTMNTAAKMPAASAIRHAGTVWRVLRTPTAP